MPRSARGTRIVAIVAAALIAASARVDAPAGNDLRPTLVTLHVHDGSFPLAITSLAKQAGVPINVGHGPGMMGKGWPNVTIDADDKPVWQVLIDLMNQVHATLAPGEFNIVPATPATAGRTIAAGPVLATFRQVEHLNQLTAKPAVADFCEVAVDVMWEPRLAVAYYLPSGRPTEATDENGRSLVPANDAAAEVDPRQPFNWHSFGEYQPIQRQPQWPGQSDSAGAALNTLRYSVRLNVPPTAGRRLAHLKGQLNLWFAGPDERAEIVDLPNAGKVKNKRYSLGSAINLRVTGVSFSRATSMSSSEDVVQVQMTAARGQMLPDAWDQARMLMQSALRVRVLDATGNEWGHNLGQSGSSFSADAMSLSPYVKATGSSAGKPDKLIVEGPVTATAVEVPYEFHALPLP